MSGLRRLLRRLRGEWRHRRAVAQLAGPKVLRAFARRRPQAFFVEIGANDGHRADPLREVIRKSRWRGLVVEPVPELFARLEHNCRHLRDRVRAVNAAVSTRDATLPFHHLREVPGRPRLPDWAHGLGSFRRDVVLKHADRIPALESYLAEIRVPAVTWKTLCARHDVRSVDLLLTDTEGHDHEILGQLDLQRWRPAVLIYEHHHFDAATLRACDERLRGQGYTMFREGLDTWCLDGRPQTGVGQDLLERLPGWIAGSGYAQPV